MPGTTYVTLGSWGADLSILHADQRSWSAPWEKHIGDKLERDRISFIPKVLFILLGLLAFLLVGSREHCGVLFVGLFVKICGVLFVGLFVFTELELILLLATQRALTEPQDSHLRPISHPRLPEAPVRCDSGFSEM